MKKDKKISRLLLIITALFIIFIFSQDIMPYTSAGFMRWIRTPFKLGFQKQVFEMHVGETLNLRVNRINVRIKYSSSDFRLAYVNMSGRVTALRAGTVIIYGEIGDKTISCKIKIKTK